MFWYNGRGEKLSLNPACGCEVPAKRLCDLHRCGSSLPLTHASEPPLGGIGGAAMLRGGGACQSLVAPVNRTHPMNGGITDDQAFCVGLWK